MAISNNATGSRPGVCTSTTRPSAPYEGQMIYETDTDLIKTWNGSAWKGIPIVTASGSTTVMTATTDGIQSQMPFAISTGTISATTNTAYQNTYYGTSAAITFPTGRFSQIPAVICNVYSGGYGWASAYGTSSTGISFIWLVADGNSANRAISWFAIQMTSGATAG